MSLLRPVPRPDDWVVATGKIKEEETILMSRSEIRAGTRGVVTGAVRGWWTPRVPVRFDTGFGGSRELYVPVARLRIVRRAGGQAAFERRAGVLSAARAGVAVALFAPILYFVAAYVWTRHTFDGLLFALVEAAVETAVDTASALTSNPVPTAIFLIVTWALSRFAFRR